MVMCGMQASELLAHRDVPAKRSPPANAAASFQRLSLHVCKAKRTRPLTLGCSAQISPPVYDRSRVQRSMESEWAIGLQQNRVGVFYAPSISQHPAASETMQRLPSSLWLIQA